MKEKVCETLKKVAEYCLCVAMIEAMMIMFVLLAWNTPEESLKIKTKLGNIAVSGDTQ